MRGDFAHLLLIPIGTQAGGVIYFGKAINSQA